jgi:hypothetical protein
VAGKFVFDGLDIEQILFGHEAVVFVFKVLKDYNSFPELYLLSSNRLLSISIIFFD